MAFLIGGANSAADTGFDVANSCRFNDDDSAYMAKTPGSAGNRRKFTISFWVKRGSMGAAHKNIFSSGTYGSTQLTQIFFESDDKLHISDYTSGQSLSWKLETNRVFRDPSAWYSIIIAVDTEQGTAANRVKMYINGTQETSFATETYPAENFDCAMNLDHVHTVGNRNGASLYFDGYIAEFVLIDGTQYAATSFGEFNSDSPTIWQPIDVSGLTFGTNGFYLDFEASDNLGNDANGGTDLTETNLAATDQATDTPTNNFCTMNPLNIPTSNPPTFSEGNLQVSSSTTGAGDFGGSSSIGVSSGKWFVETKVIDANQSAGQGNAIGISGEASGLLPPSHGSATNSSYCYKANGDKVINGTGSSYGATFTQNDIIGIALDLDSGTNTVTFYKNGASQGSIDIVSPSSTTDGFYFFTQGDTSTGNNTPSILSYNFGSPAFSISSGNADGNGHGNFEFEVPSGHFALNTKNLAEHG